MDRITFRSLAWIALLPLGLLISCSKEVSIPRKRSVDAKDNKVTVRGADWSQVVEGEGIDLPNDWPKEVPVLDDANIKMAMGQAKGRSLSYETAKDPAEAIAFYDDAMSKGDWESGQTMDLPGMSSGAFTKGTQSCHVSVSSSQQSKTIVQIVLSTK